MHDWNVVVTARDDGFARTIRLLRDLGMARRTHFFNVLVMNVDNVRDFLEAVRESYLRDAAVARYLARVSPAHATFSFSDAAEFDRKARELVRLLAPKLAGRSFHVRMHRRGLHGELSSPTEEVGLDTEIQDALRESGSNARITFHDPDAIVSVETVGNRAGIALWTREDLDRYPFLGLDRGLEEAPVAAGPAE